MDNLIASRQTMKRYNRIAPVYDLMEWFVEKAAFRTWREKLWARVKPGKILEVGVGTGKNIPYYPSGSDVTAIDISEKMMSSAKKRAKEASESVNLQMMDVQSLAFPDNHFDSAVGTFVFCSVPIPIAGFRELKRVVKPEGDIWLLEHVRINKPFVGFFMDILNPFIVRVMGANINRRTVENVNASGLKILEVQHLQGELVKMIHASPR